MSARQNADAEDVDIFLNRRHHHLLGGAVKTGVDDIHAGVAQTAGDDLDTAVVTVQADFCDQHAYGIGLHARVLSGPLATRLWRVRDFVDQTCEIGKPNAPQKP